MFKNSKYYKIFRERKNDNGDNMARYKAKHRKKLRFKKMNLVLLFSIVYSIIVLYQVISIDILPTKFLIAAIGGYTVINLLFLLLINVKKKLLRAFFFIFLVLFCDINIIGNYYINKTFSFLKTSFGSSEKVEGPTEAYNILISGHDFDNFRDFNMILTVNITKQTVLMTSVPRDYYIEVAGYGKKDKLSFIRQGINVTSDSLANLFDIKIDYYLDIDTTSVVTLVDTIGGIEYYNDDGEYWTTHAQVLDTYDDSTGSKLHVVPGWQHLNGIQVLTISRERLKLPGGDRARQKNVQALMTAIFKKMASPDIITKFDSVLTAVDGMYETTVPMANVTAIIKDTMANGNNWKINQQSVDGSDGHAPVNLGQSNDWVMFPNQESIDKAKVVIQEALK